MYLLFSFLLDFEERLTNFPLKQDLILYEPLADSNPLTDVFQSFAIQSALWVVQ